MNIKYRVEVHKTPIDARNDPVYRGDFYAENVKQALEEAVDAQPTKKKFRVEIVKRAYIDILAFEPSEIEGRFAEEDQDMLDSDNAGESWEVESIDEEGREI